MEKIKELWELVGVDNTEMKGMVFGHFTSEKLANIGLAHLPEEFKECVEVQKSNLDINTIKVDDNIIRIEEDTDSKKIPVVVRYSFDTDTPVHLFDTEDEAIAFLRQDFENECHTDRENGHELGKDMSIHISPDGTYAKIEHILANGDKDITEWFVGTIR